MTICERLFGIMDKKGLKNKDLMKALNVSSSVVSTWKTRGTNPPAEYINQICELLNIDVYTLLDSKCAYSEDELKLIEAYRNADYAHKEAAKTLLGVKEDTGKLLSSKIG